MRYGYQQEVGNDSDICDRWGVIWCLHFTLMMETETSSETFVSYSNTIWHSLWWT